MALNKINWKLRFMAIKCFLLFLVSSQRFFLNLTWDLIKTLKKIISKFDSSIAENSSERSKTLKKTNIEIKSFFLRTRFGFLFCFNCRPIRNKNETWLDQKRKGKNNRLEKRSPWRKIMNWFIYYEIVLQKKNLLTLKTFFFACRGGVESFKMVSLTFNASFSLIWQLISSKLDGMRETWLNCFWISQTFEL